MIRRLAARLLGGTETRGLARDSMLLGINQVAGSVGYLVQIALVTRFLGVREFGRLALVVAFAMLVQQFFDVRVEQATIVFGTRRLRAGDVRGTSGVIQLSYGVDLLTGVVGFAVVAALSPVVGNRLVEGNGQTLLLLYAFTLLASTVNATSGTTLRILDRYGLIAAAGVVRETLRLALVLAGLITFRSLTGVVVALLIHEVVMSLVLVALAGHAFRRRTGASLTRRSLAAVREERRAMLGMVFHTNLIAYARLAQAQVPTLVLGVLHDPLQVGIYRLGMALALGLGQVADPAISAFLPRAARLWADRRREELLRLVRHVSRISFPVMGAVLLGVVVLREPLLRLLGAGERAEAAALIVVLAGAGQAFSAALFWNGAVVIAAGRANVASRVQLGSVAVLLALLFPLVGPHAAAGAAVAFLVSTVLRNAWMSWEAIRLLRSDAAAAPPEEPIADADQRPERSDV